MPPAKKITVYPDPRALSVLGSSTPLLNQALEAWAGVIARATHDNAQTFAPEEWCLVADVCNGTLWEPQVGNPGVLIAANVEDGHKLDGAGYRWLGDDEADLAGSPNKVGLGRQTKAMRQVDERVASLAGRLAALDYAHAWAVIVAVQWFWGHCELDIDPRKDAWWALAFRRAAQEKGADDER